MWISSLEVRPSQPCMWISRAEGNWATENICVFGTDLQKSEIMACCRSSKLLGGAEGMISQAFHDDELIRSYKQQLVKARWAGRIIGSLHSLCSILAFCNLTWATVVVLGSFVDSLVSADFYIVFTLLLLEATRLASATFFTQLLSSVPNPGHFSSQELPRYIDHIAQRYIDSNPHSTLFRVLSPILQALLIAPSFVCAIVRSSRIRYPASIPNLQMSLRIFYIVIIFNAALSTLISLLSFTAWIYLNQLPEKSVLKYYDEVLHNSLMKGTVKADSFNFFHFAFSLLGRDYASYKPWAQVVKENKKLLRYLYAHKQGADYLQASLESEDAAVQQAAANTVGAWADGVLDLNKEPLQLPVELRTKLADMVGTGEVGWAAVNSFGALARNSPECVMKTFTSNRQPVLERIAELVDGSSSRSLASVRTLISFYDVCRKPQALQSDEGRRNPRCKLPTDAKERLVQELKFLLEENPVQRLRVHAAYLLYLLDVQLDGSFWDHIKTIDLNRDTHWYPAEEQMLDHLLTKPKLS